jgi:hypothetical protein
MTDYSKILGEPGKGIHKHFFGIAISDVIMTVIGAWILHRIYPRYTTWFYLAVLFVLGIVSHRLFGVKTTIDKLLFGK